MIWQLTALLALVEDLGSFSSIHKAAHKRLYLQSQ